MTIEPGARLGHYEVEAAIGAGGMGQVYRARDTRLARIVALKVLPQKLASSEGRERFEREARAVATLSHPHICALFDVGEHEGLHYLVLEHLDGETLAERLKRQHVSSAVRKPASASTLRAQSRGTMTVDRVLDIGLAIAAALESAHKQGIVHRDLKPANVMLSKSGVKLLDFGLAKLLDEPNAKPRAGDTGAPTAALTGQAQMLGTLQYMAPEQLEGGPIDARSDIFALGAILYEMVTGQRPFTGQSDASLIAAILEHEPEPPSRLQESVPPALDRLILTCLRKDPEERWHSAADIKHELRWIRSGDAASGGPSLPPRRRMWWFGVAAVGAAAAGVLAGWMIRRPPRAIAPSVALAVSAPKMDDASWIALSPDGRQLAYVAADNEGYSRVWIRPLNGFAATPLPDTQGASDVAWLHDSKSLLFVTDTGLRLIEPEKSLVRTMTAEVNDLRGATSNVHGDILYSDQTAKLYRIARQGGEAQPVYGDGKSRRWPAFLPDNRHFLVLRVGSDPGVYLGVLGSETQTRLLEGKFERLLLDTTTGYLLLGTPTGMVAHAFDFDAHRVTGKPLPVLENLESHTDGPAFTAAAGRMVYATVKKTSHQLVWFSMEGMRIASLGEPGTFFAFDLSPDETSVLVARENVDNRARHIALIDGNRGTVAVVASAPGTTDDPAWMPDGQRFSYVAHGAPTTVFLQSLSGGSREEVLADAESTLLPESWSADEKTLVLVRYRYPLGWSLVAWHQAQREQGPAGLQTLLESPTSQPEEPALWRQGDLLAYGLKSHGHWEVFLMRVPDTGDRWQISTKGGVQPRWAADGRGLYYLAPDGKLMYVAIERHGDQVRPGRPKILFGTPLSRPSPGTDQYRVTKDGQRVLISLPTTEDRVELNVVTNWPDTFGLR